MLSHVYCAAFLSIDASVVKVEVDIRTQGLPNWSMVGMLETAVKEAKDRVSSAIRNSGYSLPNRQTLINLSPADLKKSGAHYDLAIAIALLTAVGACKPSEGRRFLIAGELSLTGSVMPISGTLIMALAAKKHELDGVIVPSANAWEARLADCGEVIGVDTLAQAVSALNGEPVSMPSFTPASPREQSTFKDLGEVRGQPFAKRGLEIAAAGGHNIALTGPPGTGKTMLAERLPSILPPLTYDEALEVLKIRSCHGLLTGISSLPTERPFRAPHHSASYAGLVGGGAYGATKLGEISLAHNGVLFLDEMAEFKKDVLDVLRQPLESGYVRIVRTGTSVSYPARFMLVAAFNPCKCGYYTHPNKPCTCSIGDIRRYRSKLSGPLLDRIDLHVEVGPPPHEALLDDAQEEQSDIIRQRVLKARACQQARFGQPGATNAMLSGRAIPCQCALAKYERKFLKEAAKRLHLTARSIHRVIKVARTIADLENSDTITTSHLAEALQFRPTLRDME